MKTVIAYRIIVGIPGKGIERALPYQIYDEFAASEVCSTLNRLLEPEYTHRVETFQPTERKHNGSRTKIRN